MAGTFRTEPTRRRARRPRAPQRGLLRSRAVPAAVSPTWRQLGSCGNRDWTTTTTRRHVGRCTVTGRRWWVGSGLLVATGMGIWSLGNWVFYVMVGRLLGPRDYGLIAAVLSGCLVLYVLCSSLQPTLAASNRGEPP